MEKQITLRLSADLEKRLARAARLARRRRSEIIRIALEQYLSTQPDTKPIDKVRDLIGTISTGIPDLGENHRKYLAERIQRGRRTLT
jgi:metal-responsive CopG/Arc/MetJ family transcriptional regulator